MHEFKDTAIILRASALTYLVVLSLVPILALSTAILKGLGSDNHLKTVTLRLIDQFEPDNEIEKTNDDSTSINQATNKNHKDKSLTDHLRNGIEKIFDYVDKTNFAALGAFGVIFLLYSVVLVLNTIETSMNAIWHTNEKRPLIRKIMDYMALVLLLPVSINIALAGDAILASPKILAQLNNIIPAAWIITIVLKLLPFIFIVLSLMIMYMFFPNVKVNSFAAFIGAIFASTFWFFVQRLYISLQIGVSNYNAIYGSFATLPLFLIWVQLGWTFIFLGASLTYAIQYRNKYQLPGSNQSPKQKLQLAFDILDSIYKDYETRQTTTLENLIKRHPNELPGNIQEITNSLAEGGLLHKIDEDKEAFVPAGPAVSLEAGEVVRHFLGDEALSTKGGKFSTQVVKAAENAIARDSFPSYKDPDPENPL